MAADDDAEALFQALAVTLRAGLAPSSTAWARGLPHPLVAQVKARLERGEPLGQVLSVALSLPPHERVLLEAGERSGDLPELLDALVESRREKRKMRRRMLIALAYPCLVAAAASLLLPLPLLVNDGLRAYAVRAVPGVALIVTLLVVVFGLVPRLPASSPLRTVGPALLRSLPLLGGRLVYGATATFCEVLGRTIRAGIPITVGLPSALTATGDAAFVRAAEPARRALEQGATLDESLETVGVLPPSVHRQLAVAEQVGKLDEALAAAAKDARGAHGRTVIALIVATTVAVFAAVALVVVIGIVSAAKTFYFDRYDEVMKDIDS